MVENKLIAILRKPVSFDEVILKFMQKKKKENSKKRRYAW